MYPLYFGSLLGFITKFQQSSLSFSALNAGKNHCCLSVYTGSLGVGQSGLFIMVNQSYSHMTPLHSSRDESHVSVA